MSMQITWRELVMGNVATFHELGLLGGRDREHDQEHQ